MNIVTRRILLCLLFLTLIAAGISADGLCSYPSEQQWFSFCIEQDGQFVPVRNNRVELEKAPFTLILIMRGPMGVLVNCSAKDNLFKGFLKNKPLSKITDKPEMFMGMGEGLGNDSEKIVIDDIAPHYMFYTDGASHRFSSTELKGEYVIGRRIVANFTSFDREFEPSPINELDADVIYLSFMRSEYDEDYNLVELQKEALKVMFTE
ncbi:MAG: hypothetical protein JEZ04_14730 [Spirochaetales bacterium]|nr:hypothetical protein [Spirochaetales bacterium]